MTLLDVIIWLILIAFVVKGFTKGLISEVCSLLSLVAGGWAAFKYYPYLAGAFSPGSLKGQHATVVIMDEASQLKKTKAPKETPSGWGDW